MSFLMGQTAIALADLPPLFDPRLPRSPQP